MTVYLDLVMVLNFLVDFLLLIGTNRLSGHPTKIGLAALAAGFGAVYGGICLMPGFSFLGNVFWRLISLALMAVIAFGWNRSTLRRGVLFALLCMALGGMAMGMDAGGFIQIAAGAVGILLMCFYAFRGRISGREFVSVTIRYGGRSRTMTALCDTGNMLRDPVTGESVLVVGGDVARDFLGFTEDMLRYPVAALEQQFLPGLRLIPYRAVGQPAGMLLALCMDEVVIGKQQAGRIVAFAPEKIGDMEGYQALTGGIL